MCFAYLAEKEKEKFPPFVREGRFHKMCVIYEVSFSYGGKKVSKNLLNARLLHLFGSTFTFCLNRG